MKKFWILLAAVSLGAAFVSYSPQNAAAKPSKIKKVANAIPGRYIVVLDPNTVGATEESSRSTAEGMSRAYGGKVDKVYSSALKGFSTEMSREQAESMSSDSRVLFIEPDAEISVNAVQSNPTWGLDRVDQRSVPLDTEYSYEKTGTGVNVYVVDTGIKITHSEFGGRATADFDSVGDGQNGIDCHGHGTHVSGTIGGTTYGVAKNVSLHSVRVLGCNGTGTSSTTVAGLDWITANRVSPAIVNMSMGTGVPSPLVDYVVENSIASGITYVIAAGNSSSDACNVSPARVPSAITVGATDSTDAMAYFSNFGSCVDIFAPGVDIKSAYSWSNVATNTLSGTSMATPHVTGAVALYLEANPQATPTDVAGVIRGDATNGAVTGANGGSPNLLLYTAPNFAPTAGESSVDGRVVNEYGWGINKVRLVIQNANTGETKYAMTNPFGFYRFDGLESGVYYVVSIDSKKYVFEESSHGFWLSDDLTDVSFVGRRRSRFE